jgi:inhibitor of KinA
MPSSPPGIEFAPLGDQAVLVTFGRSIDETTHRRVRAASARIDERRVRGVIDQVPAFTSIAVHYDAARVAADHGHATPYETMVATLGAVLADLHPESLPPPRIVEIPVVYGGEFGPDLDDVARQHDLEPDDVVRIHSGGDYLVYMVGFMPGFAYLGGLSEEIATPRRRTPRTAVPAGTVGIGGRQTGVYPLESPGGWNLIGRTPRRLFDIGREEPTLLATGDRVRFRPIEPQEFHEGHELRA